MLARAIARAEQTFRAWRGIEHRDIDKLQLWTLFEVEAKRKSRTSKRTLRAEGVRPQSGRIAPRIDASPSDVVWIETWTGQSEMWM